MYSVISFLADEFYCSFQIFDKFVTCEVVLTFQEVCIFLESFCECKVAHLRLKMVWVTPIGREITRDALIGPALTEVSHP